MSVGLAGCTGSSGGPGIDEPELPGPLDRRRSTSRARHRAFVLLIHLSQRRSITA